MKIGELFFSFYFRARSPNEYHTLSFGMKSKIKTKKLCVINPNTLRLSAENY